MEQRVPTPHPPRPQLSPRRAGSSFLEEAVAEGSTDEQTLAGREGGRNISQESSKLDTVWPSLQSFKVKDSWD